jgi:hypothetical protein
MMRIAYDGNRRYWECRACHAMNIIAPDAELTIKEMADDMARGFFAGADSQRKKQTHYRRLAGGLTKLEDRKYLSEREVKAIDQAARILERLATAAEQAKKEKKRMEQEESKRLADRRAQATRMLTESLQQTTDPIETALLAVSISELPLVSHSYVSCGLTVETIARIVERKKADPLIPALTRVIRASLDEHIRNLASAIEWRDQPVADMVSTILATLSQQRDATRTTHEDLFEAIETAIAVENSDKVTRLPASKGHCNNV